MLALVLGRLAAVEREVVDLAVVDRVPVDFAAAERVLVPLARLAVPVAVRDELAERLAEADRVEVLELRLAEAAAALVPAGLRAELLAAVRDEVAAEAVWSSSLASATPLRTLAMARLADARFS